MAERKFSKTGTQQSFFALRKLIGVEAAGISALLRKAVS